MNVKRWMQAALLAASAPAATAHAQWRGYDNWGGGMMGGYGGYGMGGFGGIFMIVFGILIIVGIIVLIRWMLHSSPSNRNGWQGQGGDRSLDILRERYARGEINKEEFEQKKRDLGSR